MFRASVGMAAGHTPAMNCLLQVRMYSPGDDMVTVARMDRLISVAVKNDGRHNRVASGNRRVVGSGRSRLPTVPHGGERTGNIIRDPAGETGMHANRRIQV